MPVMVKNRLKTKFMATMDRSAAALVDVPTSRTKYWLRTALTTRDRPQPIAETINGLTRPTLSRRYRPSAQ